MRRIAAAEPSANPLYLRTLLEELRVYGDRTTLDRRIGHYLAAPTAEALYAMILERHKHHERDRPGRAREAFPLLWAARHGLAEAELLDLLGSDGAPHVLDRPNRTDGAPSENCRSGAADCARPTEEVRRMATPIPRGLMSLEEWDALPEDHSAHYELQEGVLVVSPKPARKHQKAMTRLAAQIASQCPPGWEAVADFELLVQAQTPPTVRAPDVMVARIGGSESRAPAEEVLLVIEIISPGSRKVDLHLKTFEYADAGIPHYLVVDLDPPTPTIAVFGFGAPGDGYAESQRGVTGELVVAEPFPLRIDIAGLVD